MTLQVGTRQDKGVKWFKILKKSFSDTVDERQKSVIIQAFWIRPI